MTAVLVVCGIAVGLPLLALLAARWSGWSRLRPGRAGEPWTEIMQRHRLTGPEMHRLARHVGLSAEWPVRPPEDPALRAAAVDWFGWDLRRAEERAARPGVRGLLVRGAEAPWRAGLRRAIARHGGSAEPVRRP
ncbi:hypothetical protein [Blastococcus sp. SYSU D00820]